MADFAAFMIFGMLTYFYFPFDINYKWIFLILLVTVLSRYTAIATIIDLFTRVCRLEPSFATSLQSNLLYFFFQGSVAFSLVIRMRGELLETMNVGLMVRLMLFMIWFSALQIIAVANPMMKRGYRRLSVSEKVESPPPAQESVSDLLFPYLVRVDTTECPLCSNQTRQII